MKKQLILLLLTTLLVALSAFAQDDEGDEVKVPPRKGVGRVTIITNPPNLDVYLGGELLGRSPIVERGFKAGRHTLVVVYRGHEVVQVRFNVWPNVVNTYQSTIVMPNGNIEVTTNPPRCLIYIDGNFYDKTDGAVLAVKHVGVGDHMVFAQCSNGKSREVLVTVNSEGTVKVHIDATVRRY